MTPQTEYVDPAYALYAGMDTKIMQVLLLALFAISLVSAAIVITTKVADAVRWCLQRAFPDVASDVAMVTGVDPTSITPFPTKPLRHGVRVVGERTFVLSEGYVSEHLRLFEFKKDTNVWVERTGPPRGMRIATLWANDLVLSMFVNREEWAWEYLPERDAWVAVGVVVRDKNGMYILSGISRP